jgi:CheY-like chemotaxis protein
LKSLNSHKIAFIADDDPEDIELLCEVIRDIDTSINTKVFSNGKDVLTQLIACPDQELPQFLILDYSMPELTGPQVLQEIAKQPRYSKISKFVLSTSSAAVYMEECLLTGANAYFIKPNSMAELRSIANKILRAE